MPNNRLILRKLESPWVTPVVDLTKNSVLTHDDVDNNFIYLRGELITSAGFSGGDVVLTKINGDIITVPTGAGANTFVTGGTYDVNTSIVTLTRNDAVSITIGGLKDTVVTGFTYDNANSITLSQNQGEADQVVIINTMTGLTVNGTITTTTVNSSTILSGGTNLTSIFQTIGSAVSGDTFTSGFTYDNANNITLSQNNSQPDRVVNISTMTGLTVSGTISATTVNAGDILSGGTNLTSIFQTIGGSGDTYVSGFTYDGSNNITLAQSGGQPDKVVNISTMTGLTVSGTISATTINGANILSGGTNLTSIFQTIGTPSINLATDNLIQDAESRIYNINGQNLTFNNGYFTVSRSTFGDIVNLNHSGGQLFFGGASGIGSGGSNLIHQTKFNVASSTVNCHKDFAGDTGLCLQNFTTSGGLNHYASVANNNGPLYLTSGSGHGLLFKSGTNNFTWLDDGGSSDMKLYSGVLSVATWEGVTVKEGFGGTAQSTYATGDMLYASATNTLSKLNAGSNGEVLQLIGGVPSWGVSPSVSSSGNSFTTGATIISNVIYYNRNDTLSAYTVDLNGIVNSITGATNTFTTGFTYDGSNNFTILRNGGQPDLGVNVSTMTGLTINGTLSSTTINSTSISATTVNAGDILSGGTNINSIFQTISGAISADTFTTGFTYDNANKLTVSRNEGLPDLDVVINTVTGLTVNGTLSATTINGGDILSGGTNLNSIFQTIAGAPTTDTFTTGFTYDGSNNLKISRNEGLPDLNVNISTMTGLTVNGTISATTIDGGDILSGGTNLTSIFQTIASGDVNALHVNASNEITAITEKTSVDNQDEFILEDSDALFVKKSIKRINIVRPINNSQTTTASLTPNSDEHDQESITLLSQSLTINTPSGSPTDGQKLVIRIEGDATPRTLQWLGNYEVIGVTLPVTTTANKKIYVGCIYNSDNGGTWDVVAVNIEA